MALLASNLLPELGLREAKRESLEFKNYCTVERNAMSAGNVNGDRALEVRDMANAFKAKMATYAAIPGIVQYAKDQENDQGYNIVTEYNALITEVDEVIASIETNFPTDASDWIQEKKFNGAGGYDYREFTPTQSAALIALIDDVIAAID